jgi:hypothetical protein
MKLCVLDLDWMLVLNIHSASKSNEISDFDFGPNVHSEYQIQDHV